MIIKINKRKINLVLVLIICSVLILSACQAGDTSSAASPAVSSSAEASAAATGGAQPGGAPGTPPDAQDGPPPGGQGGPGGGVGGSEAKNITLAGAYTVDGTTEMSDAQNYSSQTGDQNTVLVTGGGNLTLGNATLSKTGDTSSADESNFYGVNAALCVAGGSAASISDIAITSSAEGSNAIFATGKSIVTVDNVKIHTTGNSARGLDATYDGVINATNVDITTEGAHCAPLATDRGEGRITVTDGTVSAAGDGSPCIYSTGNIAVTNLTGTATGSQAAVVEGKNSITINSSNLTGAGPNGIMLYQSTSGDAAEGTAVFTVTDSAIKTTSMGPMIYVTNTSAEAAFTNTTLGFSSGILANIAGNSINNWGTPGSNGGTFTLKGVKQVFAGNVTCDNISTVALVLTEGSTFTGALNAENTAKEATISLDKTSVWNVAADSCVTAITNSQADCSNIVSNGHSVHYDASNSANSWLKGRTIQLSGDGALIPVE